MRALALAAVGAIAGAAGYGVLRDRINIQAQELWTTRVCVGIVNQKADLLRELALASGTGEANSIFKRIQDHWPA